MYRRVALKRRNNIRSKGAHINHRPMFYGISTLWLILLARSLAHSIWYASKILHGTRYAEQNKEVRGTPWGEGGIASLLACLVGMDRIFLAWPNKNRVMRKPAFCIGENKDADQLRQAAIIACFRYIDSAIFFLPKSIVSSL